MADKRLVLLYQDLRSTLKDARASQALLPDPADRRQIVELHQVVKQIVAASREKARG